MLRKITLLGTTLAVGALTVLGTGCNQLKSRDDLNKGVAAYKNAKYSEAVDDFQEAINLDPKNPNARVYLATAYMMQWIPGAVSPENVQFATKAKDEFGTYRSSVERHHCLPNTTLEVRNHDDFAHGRAHY